MHVLESAFLAALSEFPNVKQDLQNDYDYAQENRLVCKIVQILNEAQFPESTLLEAGMGGYMRSGESLEFENCEDYVLQAVLASQATSASVLETLIARNPGWLGSGWWLLLRLGENPNATSSLLELALENNQVSDLDEEIVGLLIRHKNCSARLRETLTQMRNVGDSSD